jgi:dihydrofolate reductase
MVVAGPNNEMDWLVWDDNYIKYLNEITESVDIIIMGRKMVDEFIPYWTPYRWIGPPKEKEKKEITIIDLMKAVKLNK